MYEPQQLCHKTKINMDNCEITIFVCLFISLLFLRAQGSKHSGSISGSLKNDIVLCGSAGWS